jgi:integrase
MSKTFARKLDAQEWANATERELESGNGQTKQTATIRQVMADYSRDVSPTKRGCRWEQLRIAAISRMPIWDRDISSLGMDELRAWRDKRLSEVSPGSVLRDISLLSAVFEYARRERRLIDVNPIRDMRKPSSPKPRTRIPTDDEIVQICAALGFEDAHQVVSKSAQVAVAFLIGIETAMRSGEIVGLVWTRVDPVRRTATLETTKNGKAREVPLSSRAVELIDKLRGIDTVRCFTVDSATRDVLFRRARDACGIVGLTFHDSRALALTRMSKVLDPYQLARVAGHSSLDQIMTYYRESAADMAKLLG